MSIDDRFGLRVLRNEGYIARGEEAKLYSLEGNRQGDYNVASFVNEDVRWPACFYDLDSR